VLTAQAAEAITGAFVLGEQPELKPGLRSWRPGAGHFRWSRSYFLNLAGAGAGG